MADNAGKTERKPHRSKVGNLLFNLFLFLLDIALTLFLFLTPLFSAGAYCNFSIHEYVFGVLYVIARVILTIVKHNRTTDILYLILRIIGIAGVAVYYVMLFNFGDYFSWFYPVRKSVYIAGNYTDAAYFDFLPDSIPSKADDYRMTFVPPTSDKDKPEKIEVRFRTDSAGITQMRETAAAKGGVLNGGIGARAGEYLAAGGTDVGKADIYGIDTGDGRYAAYVINGQTGDCVILWCQ